MQNDLNRFLQAQENSYAIALSEIKNGYKRSHWMWYIFPRLKGFGRSYNSEFYGIRDLEEAQAYLNHEILGSRFIEICEELIKLESHDALEIFGRPDDKKLKSSMTLFSKVENTHPIFEKVLEKFFDNQLDRRTLRKIENK